MTSKVRGLLLDFYGTVVEEDDPVIRRITEAIVADVGGEPSLNATIGYEWWRSFRSTLRWGAW